MIAKTTNFLFQNFWVCTQVQLSTGAGVGTETSSWAAVGVGLERGCMRTVWVAKRVIPWEIFHP